MRYLMRYARFASTAAALTALYVILALTNPPRAAGITLYYLGAVIILVSAERYAQKHRRGRRRARP